MVANYRNGEKTERWMENFEEGIDQTSSKSSLTILLKYNSQNVNTVAVFTAICFCHHL